MQVRSRLLTALTGAALTLVMTCSSNAQVVNGDSGTTAKKLIKAEEDWVVFVRNPDGKIASPQILVCMSPDGTFNSEYGLLEINHASQPSWFAGGIQIQGWKGKTNTTIHNAPKTHVLTQSYDRLIFTTAMEVSPEGYTVFSVKNGRSRTWGSFGTDGKLAVRVPTVRSDLTGYSRETSVKNTHVTHGAHRVTIMYQRRARYYYDDGTMTVDDSYRLLHRYRHLVQEITFEEWEANKEYYNVELPSDGA